MKKKSYKVRLILLTIAIIAILIIYWSGATQYLTVEYLRHYTDQMQEAVRNHYLISALAFIVALVFATTFSVPFLVVMPIGGLLFGLLPGTLYALIACSISGTIAFLSSRYLIGEFFQERWGDRLKKLNHELHEYGYLYLLGLHFMPVTPFFIFNTLCGLTKLSLFTFLWTTVVGIAPSVFIYNYIGYQLTEITQFKDLFSKELLYAFIALKALSISTLLFGRFGKKIKKRLFG
jgi:uncharacterized membrane protein YdjX (TVP38/TMEM64 family)